MQIFTGSTIKGCFSWDGRDGSYLLVNDWYGGVRSGFYSLTVSWHDVRTDRWYTSYISDGATAGQPTSNSLLYAIAFNNR
ncbi:hypothetical protein AB0O91_00495 [Kitasatospora sp. NPDC089797]|uniref:hypothetical protein n=1 Tax=Kitasatospora sp. NPDC089797 TaxID=3155298 RepID=UPI00341770A7